jgi:hypothetical protein
MSDPVQDAEDNLQQYLRQQMIGQNRVRTEADFPAAVDYRRAETADTINFQLSPDAPTYAAEGARRVIDKNTQDMIDYYNYLQFEQDPSNLLERRATDQAVYTGKVPFGYEDSDYLFLQGNSGVLGNALLPEVAERLGIPRDINVAGNRAAFSQVPIHEGMHPIVNLPKKEEEAALRALDYFRMKRYGDAEEAQKLLGQVGYDVTSPDGLGKARVLALKGAMSMTPDQFEDLSDVDKAELQESFDAYKKAPGLISSVLGTLTGEKAQPKFEDMVITPKNAAEMPEEEFNTLLKAAPAFTFERIFSDSSINITGPRMIGEGDSAVRAYQNGGPVEPKQDDMFPDALKEGIGTLVKYAPKVAKVAGRGVGDLVRSEPVSPPEFAVSRPTELTEFQMDTETLLPEELDMISDSVIGKLFSDDVVQRLEDPEERAGLFLYADKPGVTDAPPKSSLLRDTVRRSLEEQKNAFDKLRYEGQAGLREEVPLLSRSAVIKNVFNVLRDKIGPEAMSRIGDDRLLNIVEQSVRQSTIKGFADGGVVSLKDRAVNMNRGPRSNGIMQYVPYMTGATNGY